MPRLKVNNYVFYRELEVSKEEIRYDSWRAGSFNKENLIKDIEEEFRVNGASDKVPPFQTKVNLYERMKDKTHWSDLYKKIRHTLMRHYTKEFTLQESWANKAVENSAFGFHTHDRDITCVYYVKNNYPEFGTNIDEQVIIPGVEDSLLIFDGKIRHQLCNMPFELAVHPHNHRYSIVFDFNIDKSINPDNIAK